MRRVGLKVLLTSISLLCCLLIAELALRLWVPIKISPSLISDPELGFRNQEGIEITDHDDFGKYTFALNTDGCRGPRIQPGVNPVLLLGDSFLTAWGVREEHWVGSRIAAALPQMKVSALCSDDYGTLQERLLYERKGQAANPKTVVLFFYPGNDLINNSRALAGRTTVSPGDYFRPYWELKWGGEQVVFIDPLRARFRRIRLFALLESALLSTRSSAEIAQELLAKAGKPQLRETPAAKIPDLSLLLFDSKFSFPEWGTAWNETEAILIRFKQQVESNGAQLIVVVIPHRYQVEHGPAYHKLVQETQGNDGTSMMKDLDWNLPERRLAGFFERHNFSHILLLSELRRLTKSRQQTAYLPNGHLNHLGHQRMAELLIEKLQGNEATEHSTAIDAQPVDIFKQYASTRSLSFSQAPHTELFAWGWDRWEAPNQAGGTGFWRSEKGGVLALPLRDSKVTISGELWGSMLKGATLHLTVFLPDGPESQEIIINAAGRFSSQFVFGSSGGVRDGMVLAVLSLFRASDAEGTTSIFLRAINQ